MEGELQMNVNGLQLRNILFHRGLLCQIQIYPLLHCTEHFIDCSFDFVKHFEQRTCF